MENADPAPDLSKAIQTRENKQMRKEKKEVEWGGKMNHM